MSLPLTSTCVGGRRSGLEVPRFIKTEREKKAHEGLRLSARDREVIEIYIRTGLGKTAAAELGIELHSLHTTLIRANKRNGFISSIQLVAAYVAEKKRTGGFE